MTNTDLTYLRRYQDACGLLAEMAMVADHSFDGRRVVLFYDDGEGEYVVHRQWRDQAGQLQEEEMARAIEVADAVEAAYERFGVERRR